MTSRFCTCLFTLLWATLGLLGPAGAQQLTIAGTGSSSPLVQLLFDEYQQQAPTVTLHLIKPPLGSNGALKALAQGRIDIAIIGRPIPPEELRPFGQVFTLADTPFVMASSDGQRKGGFTLDDLAKVHEGTLREWDSGAPIRLVLRGSFESDTLLLKAMSPELEKALARAVQRPGMAGSVNDIETAALIKNTSGSLGPTTLGLLTSLGLRLNIFPLNGVTPSLAAMKNGSYPWRKTLAVVLPRNPGKTAVDFAAFLRSPQAKDVMMRNDYLPAAP